MARRRLLTVEHDIVKGVYAFYETHGLPLDVILASMWERGLIPDWVDLIMTMVRAGRPVGRAFEVVRSAVGDACYPIEVKARILVGLKILEALDRV